MKELARDFYTKLIAIILLLAFIIATSISYLGNKNAQSNFAKNTLGFLLLTEDKEDLKQTIEKFNKTHDQTISYTESDDNLISSLDIRDIDKLELKRTVKAGEYFGFWASYSYEGAEYISLSIPYSLGFYINWPILLAFLALGLLLASYLGNKADKDIDQYLSRLYPDQAGTYIYKPEYDDIRLVIEAYQKNINNAQAEVLALSHRLEDFVSITSNMKEGFIIFDRYGQIELMNEAAMNYLKVSSTATISNLIDDREYGLALREAQILKRSKSLDLEINDYFLRIFIDPLQYSSTKGFAMIIIDNTEESRAEQMRREFSANVTHELKSPLTSINGYAELIATGIAKEDDIAKFAEIIFEEGNRLLEIIDDILKISRLDEKNYDRDFSLVDISEVVETTIEKYERISAKKNIRVTNQLRPYRIKTSESLFHDLVSNIYENAIKYNNLGGSIKLSSDMANNSYILTIADTGIGISQADQNRIFERFYVVDKSRKRNQKSTGLGLSIVKHIANYMGYEIKIESKLGQGTSFKIIIPLDLDRDL